METLHQGISTALMLVGIAVVLFGVAALWRSVAPPTLGRAGLGIVGVMDADHPVPASDTRSALVVPIEGHGPATGRKENARPQSAPAIWWVTLEGFLEPVLVSGGYNQWMAACIRSPVRLSDTLYETLQASWEATDDPTWHERMLTCLRRYVCGELNPIAITVGPHPIGAEPPIEVITELQVANPVLDLFRESYSAAPLAFRKRVLRPPAAITTTSDICNDGPAELVEANRRLGLDNFLSLHGVGHDGRGLIMSFGGWSSADCSCKERHVLTLLLEMILIAQEARRQVLPHRALEAGAAIFDADANLLHAERDLPTSELDSAQRRTRLLHGTTRRPVDAERAALAFKHVSAGTLIPIRHSEPDGRRYFIAIRMERENPTTTSPFSRIERAIIELAAKGRSDPEIALELELTPSRVSGMIQRIKTKHGFASRDDMVLFYELLS